jgi:dienelactone hydrolase
MARATADQAAHPAVDTLYQDIKQLVEQGRSQVLVQVNQALALTYWHIGKTIKQGVAITLAGRPTETIPLSLRRRPAMRLSLTLISSVLVLGAAIRAPSAMAQDLKAQFLPPLDFKPVSFEPDVKDSIGLFAAVANRAFKPSGAGPFPAVVLMHTCGGVRNPHIKQHAQELLKAGYVVLAVDSFEPRGVENCATRILSGSAGVADAYAALAFLAGKPFVDKSRIFQVGYSWGAIVSTMLASPQSATLAGSSQRFAATVSNYSSCSYQDKYQFVLRDSDRPFLMLMGDRDQELPSASCFPLLTEMKTQGSPVEWFVFPGATHSWDKPSQPDRGYIYNERVTAEATAKMLDFLSRQRP